MVKIASSTPGVYLVGPAGKERPWCGKCHKFLKSETAAHDCSISRPSSSSSRGGRKKRIRLTPKTIASLSDIFESAAREMVLNAQLKKLADARSSQQIVGRAKSLIKKLSKGKAAAEKKYHRFVKKYIGK